MYGVCGCNWQTVEFELRKLEAQQALQQVDLLKTFMPNSFLVSGGSYTHTHTHTHARTHAHTHTHTHTHIHTHTHRSSSLYAGDYDAIQVLMLLPRMVFKADLVIDQLRQQVQHIHIHTQLTRKQAHLAIKYDLIIHSFSCLYIYLYVFFN